MENFQDSYIYPLMPRLEKGIFHTTSFESFVGIQKSGHIIPNTGQFECLYPQTKHYFAHSKGYICLFDFESCKEERYKYVCEDWQHFFGDYEPFTIVIKLNREKLAEKLIPNSFAPQSVTDSRYKGFIPDIECWYPERISTSFIDSYILVWVTPDEYVYDFIEVSKSEVNIITEMSESYALTVLKWKDQNQ